MASGLAALLDDIAALTRAAAASIDDVTAAAGRASAKAAGVVVDDAAVTPRFVDGVTPARELPIIWKIFLGSLRNKLVFIIPALLLLSQFLPWALPPLLMLGGSYLCFEGGEKLIEQFKGEKASAAQAVKKTPQDEKQIVSGAVRTDFILSAEIMMISLNEVTTETFWSRLAILIVVAIAITVGVYGVVALFVKIDDIGLALTRRTSTGQQKLGHALVVAMPKVLSTVSVVGVLAMLWVGGHILLQGAADLGWHAPYDLVHALEDLVNGVPVVGGFLGWLVNTLCSMILGAVIGTILALVLHPVIHRITHRSDGSGERDDHTGPSGTHAH